MCMYITAQVQCNVMIINNNRRIPMIIVRTEGKIIIAMILTMSIIIMIMMVI